MNANPAAQPVALTPYGEALERIAALERDLAAAQAEVARLNQSLLDCSRDWEETCLLVRKDAEAEAAALRADAERYRWLVASGKYCPSPFGGWGMVMGHSRNHTKDELDAAIDAARKDGNG